MRAVLLLIGCTALAQAQLAQPKITTLPNGVVRVTNSGSSQWAGTAGWTLRLERTIAPEDGSPGMLARPYDLGVDAHGNVVVYDYGVKRLMVFDSTGRFVRALGRTGEGPQEFENPVDITVRGDTVGVYSMNNARALGWRTNGTFLGQWMVAPCCYGSVVALDGRGNFLISELAVRNGEEQPVAVRWSFAGRAVDTIVLPLRDRRIPGFKAANGAMIGRPFIPFRSGVFDSRGRYVHGLPTTYTLIVSAHGFDTTRIVELPGARARVPEALRDSLYRRYASNRRILEPVTKDAIPEQQPYFTGLIADDEDNIWIARPGGSGVTTAYDVIDRDGRFLGTVAAPANMSRPPVVRGNRFYRFTENNDGLPVIEVYRVDKRTR